MKYFKVKNDCNLYLHFTNGRTKNIHLIKNELYTQTEKEKNNLPDKYFEEKEISKNNIFWNFGCRFEIVS